MERPAGCFPGDHLGRRIGLKPLLGGSFGLVELRTW